MKTILGVIVDQIVITGERPRFDILWQEISTISRPILLFVLLYCYCYCWPNCHHWWETKIWYIAARNVNFFLPHSSFCSCPGKCYLITKGKADIMIKFRFFTSCFGDILIRMFSFFTPLKIHLSVITSVPEKLEPKIPFYLLLSCYRCCWTIIYYHLRCITIIISSVAGR